MQTQTIVRLISVSLISLLISACGGEDDTKSVLDEYDGSKSHLDDFIDNSKDTSNGGGIRWPGDISYLNCSALDPKKVYLLGKLKDVGTYHHALIDLDDPSKFCVGFTGIISSPVTISTNGYLIHGDQNIYRMVQDELTIDTTKDEWVYPSSPYDNDEVLAENAFPNNIFYVASDKIYYTNGNHIYTLDQPDTPYYENVDGVHGHVLIVTPNGGLLASTDEGLVLVDQNLNSTSLIHPEEGTFKFFSARIADNNTIWVHLVDSGDNDKRWSIDIASGLITDDGLFNPLPENVIGTRFVYTDTLAKMDSNGRLIQLAENTTRNDREHLVVSRTLASLSNPSTIILHSDADYDGDGDWTKESNPFVFTDGILITGY